MVGGTSGHAAEVGMSASTEVIEDTLAVWSGEQGQGTNGRITMKVLGEHLLSQMEHMQYTLRSYPVTAGSRYMEVEHNSDGGRVRLKWTFLGTVMPWKTCKLSWFNILSIPLSSELTNIDWLWSQPDSRL